MPGNSESRKEATINGKVVEIAGAHLSDEEVAGKVRMLMRQDIDHEAVVTMARDRIVYLSQRMEVAQALLNRAKERGELSEAERASAFSEQGGRLEEAANLCFKIAKRLRSFEDKSSELQAQGATECGSALMALKNAAGQASGEQSPHFAKGQENKPVPAAPTRSPYDLDGQKEYPGE